MGGFDALVIFGISPRNVQAVLEEPEAISFESGKAASSLNCRNSEFLPRRERTRPFGNPW